MALASLGAGGTEIGGLEHVLVCNGRSRNQVEDVWHEERMKAEEGWAVKMHYVTGLPREWHVLTALKAWWLLVGVWWRWLAFGIFVTASMAVVETRKLVAIA